MTPRLRLASFGLAVGVSGWALTGPVARVLPAPPLLAPERWRVWLASTDPVTAAATLLRLGGVALAGWLAVGLLATVLIETAADTAVATHRSARVLHAGGRALHAAVPRPLLATAALLLGAATAGCARSHGGSGAPRAGPPGRATPATVTMARMGTPGPQPAPSPPPPPPSRPAAPAPPHPPPRWVVVRRGQSMWVAAEEVVAARRGTRAEVDRYWVALVRDNARPDPDLVYPGQVLELPPYPQ